MRLLLLSERLVKSVARKKILFVIVEGPSDEEALGLLLSRIYTTREIFVKIMHGDITTQKGVNPSNILSKIGNVVKAYAKTEKFGKRDFAGIIHIVDTDGAYIPDTSIVKDAEAVKTLYAGTEIRTEHPNNIMQRNNQKRSILNLLCTCPEIWGLPYQIFYMSCNLDHVLHNKQNSTDEEKKTDAFAFAKAYRDKIPEFIKFISDSPFSVCTSYDDSWRYIKEGLHSLERHTNLGLCFKER